MVKWGISPRMIVDGVVQDPLAKATLRTAVMLRQHLPLRHEKLFCRPEVSSQKKLDTKEKLDRTVAFRTE